MVEWAEKVLRKRTSRRAAIRVIAGGVAYTASILGIGSFIGTKLERRKISEKKILEKVFGIGRNSPSVAIIPACHHPFHPLTKEQAFYEFDLEVAQAYKEIFFFEVESRTVRGFPQIRQDDSLVLIGSQVSNIVTKKFLGNPWAEQPTLDAAGECGDWRTKLHWNHYTPVKAPILEILRYGVSWKDQAYQLVAKKESRIVPVFSATPKEDYLLVTSLPRYSSGNQRVLIFSGLRGIGTRAAAKFLKEPSLTIVQDLLKRVKHETYFQALFQVPLVSSASGEVDSKQLEFIEARPLNIEFSS